MANVPASHSIKDNIGERFKFVEKWTHLLSTLEESRIAVAEQSLKTMPRHECIVIYNDQSYISRSWTRNKKLYCSGPTGRWLIKSICVPDIVRPPLLLDQFMLRDPTRIYHGYKRERGMSRVCDWLHGYPFEGAEPDEISKFYKAQGFKPQRLFTRGGELDCNQFVFRHSPRLA